MIRDGGERRTGKLASLLSAGPFCYSFHMAAVLELSLEEFADALDRKASKKLSNFTKPLKVCRQLAVSDMLSNFAEGHDPDGQPWLPLKRPRANSKGGDRPLQDTGILRGSVTGNGPGHVETMTATSLTIGSNLDYAGIHNYGGTVHLPERRRGRGQKPYVFRIGDLTIFTRRIRAVDILIPQRRFVGIGAKLAGDFSDVFADHMGKELLDLTA